MQQGIERQREWFASREVNPAGASLDAAIDDCAAALAASILERMAPQLATQLRALTATSNDALAAK